MSGANRYPSFLPVRHLPEAKGWRATSNRGGKTTTRSKRRGARERAVAGDRYTIRSFHPPRRNSTALTTASVENESVIA